MIIIAFLGSKAFKHHFKDYFNKKIDSKNNLKNRELPLIKTKRMHGIIAIHIIIFGSSTVEK